MSITINLSPELETILREKAIEQGRDISIVAAELLFRALQWEAQDLESAKIGIQQGLKDFESGNFRSFDAFAEEQRQKYNLPTDS